MAKPIVAIVGRPNVGKSTLFNRLLGERRQSSRMSPAQRGIASMVRQIGQVEFTVVDTGGLQDEQETSASSHSEILRSTREHAHAAIDEADVIVFMVDARAGLNAGDHEVADLLRRADKPTILVANKAEWTAPRDDLRVLRNSAWATRLLFPLITGQEPGICSTALSNPCPKSKRRRRSRGRRSRSLAAPMLARAAS